MAVVFTYNLLPKHTRMSIDAKFRVLEYLYPIICQKFPSSWVQAVRMMSVFFGLGFLTSVFPFPFWKEKTQFHVVVNLVVLWLWLVMVVTIVAFDLKYYRILHILCIVVEFGVKLLKISWFIWKCGCRKVVVGNMVVIRKHFVQICKIVCVVKN